MFAHCAVQLASLAVILAADPTGSWKAQDGKCIESMQIKMLQSEIPDHRSLNRIQQSIFH